MLLFSLLIAAIGCGDISNEGPREVEINAFDYAFAAPDTIPPGWTRFRMTNHGEEEHFMLINPISEGIELADYRKAVDLLQELHNRYDSGEINKEKIYEIIGNSLGEADEKVGYAGGPGLISIGQSVEATTFLEPGRYIIECYVRTPEGIQHNQLGMMRELIVSNEESMTTAPESDYEIILTNNAINAPDAYEPGTYTFEVNFREHPVGYIGNDVHLVQLQSETNNLEEIAKWMDVYEKGGLVSPAPATFLGGTHEVPAGETAFFTVHLEPGTYAWISEIDYQFRKWKKFRVK